MGYNITSRTGYPKICVRTQLGKLQWRLEGAQKEITSSFVNSGRTDVKVDPFLRRVRGGEGRGARYIFKERRKGSTRASGLHGPFLRSTTKWQLILLFWEKSGKVFSYSPPQKAQED